PGGREGAARGARACGRAARAGGERGAPAGVRAVIVDSLVFLGESLFGRAVSADDLLAWMDELEVDVGVVAPLRPRGYHLGPANDAVAEAVREHPRRLVGLGRVDPNQGDAAAVEA